MFCQSHKEAVQNEWQAFLNLCLAQDIHLENIEEYKKVEGLWLHCIIIDFNNISSSCSPQLIVKNTFCSMQFQLDAETLSVSLDRLRTTVDPKSVSSKSNSEVLLDLEVQMFSVVMIAVQL